MNAMTLPAQQLSGIDTTKAVAPLGRQVGDAACAGSFSNRTDAILAKLLAVMSAHIWAAARWRPTPKTVREIRPLRPDGKAARVSELLNQIHTIAVALSKQSITQQRTIDLLALQIDLSQEALIELQRTY